MTAVELAATEQGSGSPLLILHGVFGSGRNWTSVAQRLAAAHRVFTLDARNHGASPWAESMTYDEMAEDVMAFRAARDLGRVALLGHSMGGKTAMLCALAHPDAVARLVIVDVAPAAYPPALASYARALGAVDLARVARRADADAQLAGAVPNPAERAFLLQNLILEDGKPRWRLNLPAIERAMPAIAGFPDLPSGLAFAGPTLFLAGDRSDYVRDEHRTRIERLFPQAQILRIAGAGHWVHAEQAAAFLDAVTPFLGGA